MNYSDHLQSPRLITRFVTQDDVAIWTEFCANEDCLRFTTPLGDTPQQKAQFFIDRSMNRYKEGTYGLQALISKETGEFIGQCGLLLQTVNDAPVIEVGYHLLPRHWGKGYATEAAQLFRDYAFENNITDSVVSIIDPLNELSKKVATRNGMRLVETNARLRDAAYNLYRITRQEWEAIKAKV